MIFVGGQRLISSQILEVSYLSLGGLRPEYLLLQQRQAACQVVPISNNTDKSLWAVQISCTPGPGRGCRHFCSMLGFSPSQGGSRSESFHFLCKISYFLCKLNPISYVICYESFVYQVWYIKLSFGAVFDKVRSFGDV